MYGTGLLRGKECPVARAPPELMPIMAPWPPYYFGHVRPVFKEENLLAGGVASSLVGTALQILHLLIFYGAGSVTWWDGLFLTLGPAIHTMCWWLLVSNSLHSCLRPFFSCGSYPARGEVFDISITRYLIYLVIITALAQVLSLLTNLVWFLWLLGFPGLVLFYLQEEKDPPLKEKESILPEFRFTSKGELVCFIPFLSVVGNGLQIIYLLNVAGSITWWNGLFFILAPLVHFLCWWLLMLDCFLPTKWVVVATAFAQVFSFSATLVWLLWPMALVISICYSFKYDDNDAKKCYSYVTRPFNPFTPTIPLIPIIPPLSYNPLLNNPLNYTPLTSTTNSPNNFEPPGYWNRNQTNF